MKALILTRVSTVKQEDISPEEQEKRSRAFCVAKGWIVVDVIRETITGAADLDKRSLEGILKREDWDVLVVLKLDRLARRAKIIHEVAETIVSQDRHLATVVEGIDSSTFAGKVLLPIFAAFAEIELLYISERATRGISGKRARGFMHLPRVPRGFDIVETRPDGSRVIAPSSSPSLVNYQQERRFAALVKRWQTTQPWVLAPSRKRGGEN